MAEQAQQSAEKDYTGVCVANLPKDEQIKVAHSVQLSAQAYWGEGGPMYDWDVAEAFMLGLELPRFEDGQYGMASPWEKERNASVFLNQGTYDNASQNILRPPNYVYYREIALYTDMGLYTISLSIDEAGNVLGSGSDFQYDYEDDEGKSRQKVFVTHMEHPVRLADLLAREPHPLLGF